MGKMGVFDLEKQYALYGSYHTNPVNIYIHLLLIWPIFFCFIVYLHFTPPLFDSSTLHNHGLVLNFGFIYTLIHALFYLCLEKKSGSLAAMLCFICWALASSLANHLGSSLAWKVALATQLFCFTGQFIGHGVFEKRAPAFLDNLLQAGLMAPFFVLLEALQMFFGFEPYPGFYDSAKARIEVEIKDWHGNKQKNKTY